MTSGLDDRIRGLAPVPEELTPLRDLEHRADRRRTRRRSVVLLATVVVLVAGFVAVATRAAETDPGPVVAQPSPDVGRLGQQVGFGGASGVALVVTPAEDLVDGQQVEVTVDGLDALPGAVLAVCRGDLVDPVGLDECDLGAVDAVGVDEPSATVPAKGSQQVVVHSRLRLGAADDSEATFDCASEPVGCVLAVGTTGPVVKGVAVPVGFVPGSSPTLGDEAVAIAPATDLSEEQVVSVSATGLDPARPYQVVQCAPATEEPARCAYGDGAAGTAVIAGADGRFTIDVVVRAAVWSSWDGVVDCTVRKCHLQVLDGAAPVALSAPLAFAADVEVVPPRLVLDPAGPHADGQQVVVRGSGFVPGSVASQHVAQCPAALDTRKEDRCGYPAPFGGVEVGPDGTFELVVVLHDSLLLTGSCREGEGCVMGWVIGHGPLVAAVPLEFR